MTPGDPLTEVSEGGVAQLFPVSTASCPLRGNRVLVTGGSGFIGSRVVAVLARAGADVVSVDVCSPSWLCPGTRFERCDIRATRFAELVAEVGPHVIVHLAAQVGVPLAWHSPAQDADVNVCGTIRVAEAAAAAGVALLVNASSCAVYGVQPDAALPVREELPTAPVSPYGLSKATAMDYLDWFARQGRCGLTSLVLGNVYGLGGRGVISEFLADAAAGRASVMHGDGLTTRDFVHVNDVAAGVLRACLAPPAGRVHLASGTETSVAAVWRQVSKSTGSAIAPQHAPARAAVEAGRMCLSIDRAAARLGWAPQVGLDEGVAALVRQVWEASA